MKTWNVFISRHFIKLLVFIIFNFSQFYINYTLKSNYFDNNYWKNRSDRIVVQFHNIKIEKFVKIHEKIFTDAT